MSNTLTEIAQQLSTPKTVKKTVPDKTKEVEETKPVPKVQLIYAFNGTGKTRLSREFKQLIAPKADGDEGDEEVDQPELSRNKILYYNALTEDLFYWDNDLAGDADHRLKIQPNSFTDWILKDQGQDRNIVTNFQRYASEKLTPRFNEEYTVKDKDDKEITVKAFSEVTFSLERGDDEHSGNLKISKGEESNFIWSVFYTLLEQVIGVLNVPEPADRETNDFDQLEYVFIDDPVSSLDENHLIELAVNLAGLIKSSQFELKFIVSTHSPLFYNVLYNEFNSKTCYMLERFEDGSFTLTEKPGDSNKSFSYHLYLKQTIEQAIAENKVEKYHFTLLRNLYEKTASFLGYPKWSELLPGDKQLYLSRIINFTSHSTLSNEAVAEPTPQEKAMVKLLLDHLKNEYGFWQQAGN
jgi:AAA domain